MLKVAMLGKWHVHADGYAKIVNDSGKAQVVAVWDDDPVRGADWAKSLGCEFIADLDTLLARQDIEAVVCDTPTTAHEEVLTKAARAKKHIFTEKALAPTMEECVRLKKEIEDAGVTFVISFPQRGRSYVQFAKKMIAEGHFGKITLVRARDAHSGVSGNWLPDYWFDKDDAAGGAMMDLGCHPMYLLAYLLGKPLRVSGLFTAPFGKPVDENAVAIAEFADGALGVAETSFDSFTSPQTLEIYGTDATLIAHGGDDVRFASKKLGSVVNGFIRPTLPPDQPLPLNQFIDACIDGVISPEGLGIDDALALTELLENAYLSNENNSIIVC